MGEILLSVSVKSLLTLLLCGYTGGKQDQVMGEIEALVKCHFSKKRKNTLNCKFPEVTKSFLIWFF